MKILVDADACPKQVKIILFRAANRVKIKVILFANRILSVPSSNLIQSILVDKGDDVADMKIVDEVEANDLVITADIPLANNVIEKGAHALNPRGAMYSKENIKSYLSSRDYFAELRKNGIEVEGGPKAFGPKDQQKFANQLDKFLAHHHRP